RNITIQALEDELSDISIRTQSLQQLLDEQNIAKQSLEDELSGLSNRNQSLQQSLDERNITIQALEDELSVLNNRNEEITQILTDEERQRRNLESQLKQLNDLVVTLTERLNSLISDRTELQNRNTELENESSLLQGQFAANEKALKDDVEQLRAEVLALTIQIRGLNQDLTATSNQNQDLASRINVLQKEKANLQSQLETEESDFIDTLEQQKSEIEKLLNQINELQLNLTKVDSQNSLLESQLESTQGALYDQINRLNQTVNQAIQIIDVFLKSIPELDGVESQYTILGQLESMLNPDGEIVASVGEDALITRVNELIRVLEQVNEVEKQINAVIIANQQSPGLGAKLNDTLVKKVAELIKYIQELEATNAALQVELKKPLGETAQGLSQFHSQFMADFSDIVADLDGVSVSNDRFIFSTEVLFDIGRAELSDSGKEDIRKVANQLLRLSQVIPEDTRWILRVDGHTDSRPIACSLALVDCPYSDNWELSQARALSVVKYLVEDLGFPPENIAAAGFSYYQSVADNSTEEGRKRNRRIELKLTEP
ncbi:MAG: OmpA family protein, partial [Rhodobacteraceae bacterium]|nr:OmpA family protein [Paracoccaceae bacterium]